jgi:transcriptional regulator with XRE-family HTH domain
MSMDIIRKKAELINDLQDKETRDSFVSDHINIGIPLQIRALREQKGREWTQQELANKAGMKQTRISAIENINYKNAFTLSTLMRIASAFDVALIVRFVPISELVKWELDISPEKLEAVSFDEDPYFQPPVYTHVAKGGLILGGENIVRFINPFQNVRHSQPKLTLLPGGKQSEEKIDELQQKEIENPLPIKMIENQFQQVEEMR